MHAGASVREVARGGKIACLIGLAMAAATLLVGRIRAPGLSDRVAGAASVAGYAFLAGAVLVGGIQGLDNIRRILSL